MNSEVLRGPPVREIQPWKCSNLAKNLMNDPESVEWSWIVFWDCYWHVLKEQQIPILDIYNTRFTRYKWLRCQRHRAQVTSSRFWTRLLPFSLSHLYSHLDSWSPCIGRSSYNAHYLSIVGCSSYLKYLRRQSFRNPELIESACVKQASPMRDASGRGS